MHARLFLVWLAIAIIAVAGQRDAYYEEYDDDMEDSDGVPLKVRGALAEEALGVLHEHGEDVDVSLDGYDHNLVARGLDDEPIVSGHEDRDAGLDNEALRKLGRMKPHYVQHHARDDDEDDEDGDDQDDDTPYVDLDPEDEDEDEDADVTFANIVPDPAGDSDELAQPPISARGVEGAEDDSEEVYGDDFDEEYEPGSYDSELYARSYGLDSEDGEEVDYSLEGYDPSVLRRGEEDDEFEEEDFDSHSFLGESGDSPASAPGAHISERDIAANADEGYDGTADEWEERNARYVGKEPEPTAIAGKPLQHKRAVVEEVDEDDEDGEATFSRAWSQVRRWAEDVLT